VEVLFEDLSMKSLRDLTLQLDANNGEKGVMKVLREKAAPEYGKGDMDVLGLFSELFEWVGKGKFYSGESAGATFAGR
jgi:hypothetical protein